MEEGKIIEITGSSCKPRVIVGPKDRAVQPVTSKVSTSKVSTSKPKRFWTQAEDSVLIERWNRGLCQKGVALFLKGRSSTSVGARIAYLRHAKGVYLVPCKKRSKIDRRYDSTITDMVNSKGLTAVGVFRNLEGQISHSAVRKCLTRLRKEGQISHYRRWSSEEDLELATFITEGMTVALSSEKLGRSKKSTYARLRYLRTNSALPKDVLERRKLK